MEWIKEPMTIDAELQLHLNDEFDPEYYSKECWDSEKPCSCYFPCGTNVQSYL